MGMKSNLAAALFAALVTGCAGTSFSFDDARRVQVGMTEDEVREIMGRPYMVRTKGDKDVWVWSHANGLTGGSQVISFIFKDGKVESVPRIPESFR